MSTWLNLVNDLQIRLREAQSSSVTETTYSTLLGQLVNQAKDSVEDTWDWHCLRTVLSFTTSNGVATYAITGSNERSRFFSPNKEIYDDTNDGIILPAPDWYIDNLTYIGAAQSGSPQFYRIRGISSGELQLTIYPTPTSTLTIRVPMVVPQATLTAGGTVLTIPTAPVTDAAYALALRERGEDGGTTFVEALRTAQESLFQAQMRDLDFNPDESIAILV